MSMKELERFQKDLTGNEGLRNDMKAAGSDTAAQISLANSKGYGISSDDISKVASAELSDEALEGVAGGIIGIGTGNKYIFTGGGNTFINW